MSKFVGFWLAIREEVTDTLDPSHWRKKSRIIAYAEIILSTVTILFAILHLVHALSETINGNSHHYFRYTGSFDDALVNISQSNLTTDNEYNTTVENDYDSINIDRTLVANASLVVGVDEEEGGEPNEEKLEEELHEVQIELEDVTKDTRAYRHKVLWSAAATVGAISCIDMWASVTLLRATKPDTDPKLGMERAKMWRYINITLALLAAEVMLLQGHYILFAVKWLIRAFFIFVVSKFIEELGKRIQASKQSGTDFIVVQA